MLVRERPSPRQSAGAGEQTAAAASSRLKAAPRATPLALGRAAAAVQQLRERKLYTKASPNMRTVACAQAVLRGEFGAEDAQCREFGDSRQVDSTRLVAWVALLSQLDTETRRERRRELYRARLVNQTAAEAEAQRKKWREEKQHTRALLLEKQRRRES